MDTDGKGTAICVLIRVIRVIRGCGWLRLAVLRSLRLVKFQFRHADIPL